MTDQFDQRPAGADGTARWLRLLLAAAALLALLLVAPATAAAATFTVNSTDDAVDVNPGNGVCATGTGVCTLRAAVMEANASAGADVIRLPPGTYTLSLAGTVEDLAATGDLDITDGVTITSWLNGASNPDATATIIEASSDASKADRVFSVNPSFLEAFDTTFRGLTIRNGRNTNPEDPYKSHEYGGAMDWDGSDTGSLTIDNCIIEGNRTENGGGGGVAATNGTVTISNSIFRNNSAKRWGGGLYLAGVTGSISNTTIDGNTVAQPSAAVNSAEGGGLYFNSGSLTMSRSAVTNNSTTGDHGGGGGIYTYSPSTITDSTISGNTTTNQGGGLVINLGSGTAQLKSLTITQNHADTDGGGDPTDLGGGIYLKNGDLLLHNSIVAQNFLGTASTVADDMQKAAGEALNAASSYNLIGTGGGAGLVNGSNGNQVGVANPGLGPLADNGGPTRTHALLTGSPAADAGNGALASGTDQRGMARPADHANDADTVATADIGAFEAHLSIENIPDRSITGADSFLFTVADPTRGITGVSASSGNTTVIPNDAAHLSVTAGPDAGHRTLNLAPAAAGTSTITVTVTGPGGSAEETFVVTVVAQPDLTIAQADSGPFSQGGSGSYSITVTNSGLAPTDGTAVTVTGSLSAGLSATGISGTGWSCALGTLTCTRSGVLAAGSAYPAITLAVSVAADAPASVSSTATVSGGGDAAGGTVTTTTTVLQQAKTPSVTPATTAEDTQSSAGLVITKAAGDAAAVTHFKITAISGGRLFKSDGSTEITDGTFITAAEGGAGLRFTPATDQNSAAGGSFSFAAQAALSATGDGLSETAATATITVTAVNDAPVPDSDALATVAEDSGEFVLPAATLLEGDSPGPADESGQSLTVTAVAALVGGSVTLSGGNVAFTPAADFHGTATFTYTVQDDGTTGGASDPKTATGTVSFTVTPVNDPPVAVADTLSAVAEDSAPFTVPAATLLGNDTPGPSDESGQSLAIIAVGDATGGTVSLSGGVITFAPAANFSGTAGFSYTVQDDGTTNGAADPRSGLGSVTFSVIATVEPPAVTPATTPEETQSTAGLVISPDPADAGVVTHYKISAITGGSLYQSDGFTPIASGSFITVAQGAAGLRFTPTAEKNTAAGDSFGFVVQAAEDGAGAGLGGPTTATITVTAVNDAPVAFDDSGVATVAEDSGALTLPFDDLLGNDTPGPLNEFAQDLTIVGVSDADGGSVVISGANVLFTPAADFNGSAGFTYTIRDNGTTNGAPDARTATAMVTLTVTPVNDPPTAVADSLAPVAEDSGPFTVPAAALLVNDLAGPPDESGQSLTLLSVSGATGGTVSLEGGVITFTPAANYNGPAGFGYTVGDDGTTGGVADPKVQTGAVTFTVTPANDPPVALDGTLEAVAGTSQSGTLVGEDLDGDTLTYSVAVAPTLGTVTIRNTATGAFTYRATRAGTDSFSFQVSDGTATSNLATISITVTSPPLKPIPPLEVTPPPALTREATVTITGKTNPYMLVQVGDTSVRAGSDGRFRAVISLAEGTNLITVRVENRPPESFVVVRDSTPPPLRLGASVIITEGDSAVLTAITEEGATTVIEGQPGSHLTVRLAPGENRFTAVATDRAGNQSVASVLVVRNLPRQATAVIPPGKPGEVVTDRLRIDLPAGTSSQTLHLTVRTGGFEDAGAPPRLPTLVVVLAEVTATRADGTPVHALDAAVTLTFTYDPALVSDPQSLAVYWYDPARERWERVGGVVDAEAHTVTVLVDHLSWFAVMALKAEEPGPKPEIPPDPGTPADRFTDLAGHWAREAIGEMVRLGVVTGYADATFRPELPVTRLEFAVMIARLLKLEPAGGQVAFTDADQVPDWASGQVAAAVRAGIIRGRADGSFAPGDSVTRAEVAVMLIRALEYRGQWLPEGEAAFADRAEIPEWALREVAAAARIYLVAGYEDGTFRPAGQTTRAEAVTMLNRLLKALSQ